jgi:hypothetical protein
VLHLRLGFSANNASANDASVDKGKGKVEADDNMDDEEEEDDDDEEDGSDEDEEVDEDEEEVCFSS